MNRQVERMVRSPDVEAAQAHMRKTTGTPFVAAPSKVNGKFYSADENALIALHKMRLRLAGRDRGQQGVSAWPRAKGAL